MTQSRFDYAGLPNQMNTGRVERKTLELEKLGVIAGFLFGLIVWVGLINEPLTAAGVPDSLIIISTVFVVALFTVVGLRLGIAAGKHYAQTH